MPLATYTDLKTSVLGWLARPGDPLVEPAVPDLIALFEAEANRRLRTIDAERYVALPVVASPQTREFVVLPLDCWQVRTVSWSGRVLRYRSPVGDWGQAGADPISYTLYGQNTGGAERSGLWTEFYLRLSPIPSGDGTVEVIYQVGVPPLAGSRPTNWLLNSHPDAYLFGTMAEAELYIGHDERAAMWMQRRDAVFGSIEAFDRKTRWSGPMQITVDGISSSSGGGGGVRAEPPPFEAITGEAPPANPRLGDLWFDGASAQLFVWFDDGTSAQWVPATNQPGPTPGPVTVLTPASGDTSVLDHIGPYFVNNSGTLVALTIRLPPLPTSDDMVEIGFANPVTVLSVRDAGGFIVATAPTSAYGPGAALQFRYISGVFGWVLWK